MNGSPPLFTTGRPRHPGVALQQLAFEMLEPSFTKVTQRYLFPLTRRLHDKLQRQISEVPEKLERAQIRMEGQLGQINGMIIPPSEPWCVRQHRRRRERATRAARTCGSEIQSDDHAEETQPFHGDLGSGFRGPERMVIDVEEDDELDLGVMGSMYEISQTLEDEGMMGWEVVKGKRRERPRNVAVRDRMEWRVVEKSEARGWYLYQR